MPSSNPALEAASLVARLQESFGMDGNNQANELDLSTLRYVVYARKSTDSSEKQERSISDQLHACREFADRLGLRIIDLIHEEQSAKTSDKRPKFREMLNNITAGKYDAIITWAPDRLARNMKEAGEIIDLLDKGVIRDLKFANNFVYTNDPSGKMLLGISFVMAKQYSDQHGQNVNRAIRRKTLEGKYAGSHAKHGYYKDALHFLRPDGENFVLVSEVLAMRLRKAPLLEIATWLKGQGFPRKTKHTSPRNLVINEKFISDLIRDPIYAGIMVFGKQVVNLHEKYDFVAAISPQEFDQLCKQDGIKKKFTLTSLLRKTEAKAGLMQGMVICAGCKRNMYPNITTKPKQGKSYFNFCCRTSGCKWYNKSVRAKVILAAIYEFLDKHPFTNKKAYDRYVPEMQRIITERMKEVENDLRSLNVQQRHLAQRITDTKEQIRNEEDTVLIREYKRDLKEQLEKAKILEAKIKVTKQNRERANDVILTYENFYELFHNLAQRIQNIERMDQLDFVIKKLFTNFLVDGQKVLQITQNSPFRELCGSPNSENSVMVAPRGIEPLFTP